MCRLVLPFFFTSITDSFLFSFCIVSSWSSFVFHVFTCFCSQNIICIVCISTHWGSRTYAKTIWQANHIPFALKHLEWMENWAFFKSSVNHFALYSLLISVFLSFSFASICVCVFFLFSISAIYFRKITLHSLPVYKPPVDYEREHR